MDFVDQEYQLVGLCSSGDVINELIDFVFKGMKEDENTAQRENFAKLAQQGKLFDVVSTFLTSLLPKLSENQEDEDGSVVTAFMILFYLMRHLSSSKLSQVVKTICTEVSSKTDNSSTRFAVLKGCHTTLGITKETKLITYISCYKYVAGTSLAATASTGLNLAFLSQICKKWGLDDKEKVDLLSVTAECMEDENQKLEVVKEIFALVGENPSISPSNGESLAVFAGIASIKNCFGCDFGDIFRSSIFQKLQTSSDSSHKSLFKILKAFCTTNTILADEVVVTDFEKLGLAEATVKNDVRLMALARFCSNSKKTRYVDLAEFLHIPESEVEAAVVKAASSGLIDARLNQLNREIIVTKAVAAGDFEGESKESSLEGLSHWTKTVRSCLSSLPTLQ